MIDWAKLQDVFCKCFGMPGCSQKKKEDCVCRELGELANEQHCNSVEQGCLRVVVILDDVSPTPNIIGASVSVVPGCNPVILGAGIKVGDSDVYAAVAVPESPTYAHDVILGVPIPFEAGIIMEANVVFKTSSQRVCRRTLIETTTIGS